MDVQKTKDWIASQSYKELLWRWRNSPAGDPLFSIDFMDIAAYFERTMQEKKEELEPGEQVAISKEIGWRN